MAASIFRIVFNNFNIINNFANIPWRNHPTDARHLANCVRQDKQTVGGTIPYQRRNSMLTPFQLEIRDSDITY